MTDATNAVAGHIESFFDGHAVSRFSNLPGLEQTLSRVPDFELLVVGPGPRTNLWAYVTVGCWDAVHDDAGHGLEFFILSPEQDARHLLTLGVTAYYHGGEKSQRLDHGHTVPIGEPWMERSLCDHLLVSMPYTFGPELEFAEWDGGHARVLWLLPITPAEREFKITHGLEALEQRLEDSGVEYWKPERPSVV